MTFFMILPSFDSYKTRVYHKPWTKI